MSALRLCRARSRRKLCSLLNLHNNRRNHVTTVPTMVVNLACNRQRRLLCNIAGGGAVVTGVAARVALQRRTLIVGNDDSNQ
jgi:hypothetical protein